MLVAGRYLGAAFARATSCVGPAPLCLSLQGCLASRDAQGWILQRCFAPLGWDRVSPV